MMRRSYLSALGLAAAWPFSMAHAAADSGITSTEIVLGQSVALTGALAALGRDIDIGAHAYFDALNERGGVHGRRIRLITMDDAYKAPDTVKNVQKMLNEDGVFALFSVMGTPNVLAILPLLEKESIPFFAPFTGAESVRTPMLSHVFNLRAGYVGEADKMVQHLSTINIKRISVMYQNNSFGTEGLAAVQLAMNKRGIKLHSSAAIESDATNVAQTVQTLAATSPEAVIIMAAGKPGSEFIKAYNKVGRGMHYYAISVMGSGTTVKALGADGVGVVVTSVVPFPWGMSNPMAKEYQAAMLKAGHTEFSFVSFETYINARVFAEIMQRVGRDPTRAKFIAAAENMQKVSFNGFDVSYGKDNRQGSKFVDLTIIGPNGKFIK